MSEAAASSAQQGRALAVPNDRRAMVAIELGLLRQCMAAWAADIDWTVSELISAAEHHQAPAMVLDIDDSELLLPGQMPRRINRQLTRRGLEPLEEGAESAPKMVALLLHSLAARYGEIVRTLTRLTGKRFRRIYIVGGASRNTFLNRLTANATGLEVLCGAVESSTIGNFAVQLAALEGGGKSMVWMLPKWRTGRVNSQSP
jgi:rhamnulokinase